MCTGLTAEELHDMEEMAIEVCDTDKNGCLTWEETKACEEKYSGIFEDEGIPVPTEEDFNAFDENDDDCLTIEDWEKHVGYGSNP